MPPVPEPEPALQPLPYHRAVVAWLQHEEPQLWGWFAGQGPSREQADALRLELLTSACRLDRATHADLYQQAQAIANRLGVGAPVTCYQAQLAGGALNAGLCGIPDEAHIVFQGPVLSSLDPVEVAAVLAHELGHFRLRQADGGACEVAERILEQSARDHRLAPSHLQTIRRWRLASEVVADRASLVATGDLEAVVRTLVRMETGGAEVSGAAYLAQADEILSRGAITTEGITHPECFIRAAALAACARRADDLESQVERLLIGPLDPHDPDVLGQQRCREVTRHILAAALEPHWMRADAILAYARQFLPDLVPGGELAGLDGVMREAGDRLRDYVCYLYLDLALADRDLGDLGLAHALTSLGRWGWSDRFADLAQRELRLKAKEVARLKAQAAALVATAPSRPVRP